MTRIKEKVKDLVDVRRYEHLHDFLAEPEKTLSGYHYTPATSELMANWLNDLCTVESGKGRAKALAGYRGVGKSHFLATLGALLAFPELRTKIEDSHVSASIHHLKRRHYPVAHVRRGTKETFTEEFVTALTAALNLDAETANTDIESLIKAADESASGVPFVIIIDTAVERESRVTRDDGTLLGELAEISKNYNIFIGVALDDDITGADGINAAIAQTYTIDYLDQEHLYQIVDSHIFPKHGQALDVIKKLYQDFRLNLPSFKWSEPLFASLYPLHPSILEVAPFVRFYAADFALLGFASNAGTKIMGRPANSLISLDEVFDRVEATLRKSPDLEESFAIYDRVLEDVISEIPVMQRLRAKLILKTLFILSLDGDGATAGEIGEALLIFDPANPEKGTQEITDLIEGFVTALPEQVVRKEETGRDVRYSIRISGKDDLNSKLEEASSQVPADAVEKVLRRVSSDKLKDWELGEEEVASEATKVEFLWRGTSRSAEVVWDWDGGSNASSENQSNDFDVRVFVSRSGRDSEINSKFDISWSAAEPTDEELASLKRLYVLLNDKTLREEFGEQVRAAGHSHFVTAEKIWNRLFFKDGQLTSAGESLEIPALLDETDTLSGLFEQMFAPVFEAEYPDHPEFAKPIGMKQVSVLVNDLFSGARGNVGEVQEFAEIYADPLGLVTMEDGELALRSEADLLEVPLVKKVVSAIEDSSKDTIALDEVYPKLKEKPFGLSRATQNLLLAALVAQRKVEFVTSSGDRINHRSLDLKIVWEDIVGVAQPSEVVFDDVNLKSWAQTLLESENIEVLDAADQQKTVEALSEWLDKWNQRAVGERFGELSDEILNTRIWYVSTRVEKSFGAAAKTVKSIVDEIISLEEGLQRIADTFFDSKEEFKARRDDLQSLEDFISGVDKRERVWSYLAVCETTQDQSIEKFRANLLNLIDDSYQLPDASRNAELSSLWENFQGKFAEHFAIRHNAIMNSQQMKQEFEKILKSDEWWEFECLSKLPIFNDVHWNKAQNILRRFNELHCGFDVNENLKSHPFCACSFSLTRMGELAKLSHSLSQTIDLGRKSYRKTLKLVSSFVIDLIEETIEKDKDASLREEADILIAALKARKRAVFTSTQLSILASAMHSISKSTSIEISYPEQDGLFTSEELRARFDVWFNDLPSDPILLKL